MYVCMYVCMYDKSIINFNQRKALQKLIATQKTERQSERGMI